MTNKEVRWAVYEISTDAREYGRLVKNYKTKESATKAMNKSIYRYIKEKKVYSLTI